MKNQTLPSTSALDGGWSTPRPGRFTPGKDPIPIVQEAGWDPGSVWTDGKNLATTGIRSPDRPARSEFLFTVIKYFWYQGSLTVCGRQLGRKLKKKKAPPDLENTTKYPRVLFPRLKCKLNRTKKKIAIGDRLPMPGWKPITFPDVVFTERRTVGHVMSRCVYTQLPSTTYHTHKCSTCLTTWAGLFVVEWNCSPAPRLTTIKLNHGSREVRPTILSHKTWPFSLRATTPNTLHIFAALFYCFFLSQ